MARSLSTTSLGMSFALHVRGLGSGDLQGQVIDEGLEFFVPGHEVRFTVDFDEHADFAAHMNIGVNQPLVGFPAGFLLAAARPFCLR